MNILFLTLVNIVGLEEKQNIYADLCRELVHRGHKVHIVCPDESGEDTRFAPYRDGSGILHVKTGRVQKTNIIRKGITTILLGSIFKKAIRKHLKGNHYDLVMYSTPPITLVNIVKYIKKRDGAKTYLLLKDIFPQNAVDLGMMSKSGIKAPIYRYFRRMERKLYGLSDLIGCMSQANVDYIKAHEPQISQEKLHISPNAFEPQQIILSAEQKNAIRQKYDLPTHKKLFIYGGNLGRPQAVPYIIDCMKAVAQKENCYFVICGTGTEYSTLESYVEESKQENLKLIPGLPRKDYEEFVGCGDVGLIFLDHRFTIPNFPSRLLSYMQKSMPIIACTDPNTDVGQVITEGGFGWWCESNDPQAFVNCVNSALTADLPQMGASGFAYLNEHYNVEKVADMILDKSTGVME
ncbi:MAG: glycosyltransferase family 4 protein [Oscillospiraceae bacterium]|nr:glycosyltransferase family 4 protein [Oscillospiraceae bacterium]